MGPIILAFLFGIIYLIEITIVFNVCIITKRAKFMLILWIFNVPLLISVYFVSVQCGVMNSIDNSGVIINLLVTMFFYTAGFFGIILQLYNLADRGFSLRMLIDLLESEHGALNLDGVMQGYSNGNGIAWMYQKRIDGMIINGLITLDGGLAFITNKGEIVAKMFRRLRILTNLNQSY